MVGLPAGLFHETRTPVSLWVLGPDGEAHRDEVLFVDASAEGRRGGRRHRSRRGELTLPAETVDRVVAVYRSWVDRHPETSGQPDLGADGFAAKVPISRIADSGFVLAPQTYVTSATRGGPSQGSRDAVTAAATRLAAAQSSAAEADAALAVYLKERA